MTAMNFDITASDQASKEFLVVAAAAEKLEDKLKALDGKTVEPTVDLNIDPANRKLDALNKRLEALKNVRAAVAVDGAEDARKEVSDLVVELRKVKDTKVNLGLTAGTAKSDIKGIVDELKKLRDAKVGVTVDVKGADKLDDLKRKIDELKLASPVKIRVEVENAGALSAFAALGRTAKSTAGQINGTKANFQPGADASKVLSALGQVRGAVAAAADDISKQNPKFRADMDASSVLKGLKQVESAVQSTAGKIFATKPHMQATADVAPMLAALQKAQAAVGSVVNDINGKKPMLKAGADVAPVLSALSSVESSIKNVTSKTHTAKVKVDTDEGGISRLAKLGLAIGALSPLAVAAGGASTAAVASLGGAIASAVPIAVAGLGMLGGTLLAVEVATNGVGAAFAAFRENDMKKFEMLLGELSPQAKAFTLTLTGLYSELKRASGAVQDKMFDGLSQSLQRLGQSEVPLLIRGMGGVATELNKAAKEAMGYLGSAEGIARQTSMWVSTRQVVANLAPAFTDVIAILSDLGEVGGKVLADVTDGVGGVTQRWREWIAEARTSGKLEEIMRGGVEVFRKLGSIIGNTGSILFSFFQAASTAGSDFLGTLDRGTEAAARFLKSAEGQSSLVTFFRESREAIDGLMPGLAAVGRGIMEAVRAFGDTNGLAEFGAAVGEILTQVGAVLGPLGTLAGNTLKMLAQGAAAAASAIGPIIAGLLDLINACGPVGPAVIAMAVAFAGLQKVGGWVSGVRDQMTSLGQGVDRATTPLRRFGDEMRQQQGLAKAAGQEVGALGAASRVLAQRLAEPIAAYGKANTAVRSFADAAGKSGQAATVALGDKLAAGAQKGVDGVLKLGPAATQAGTALSTGLQTAVTRARAELDALPQTVSSAASTLKTGLGVAAIDAGQKVTALGASAREAGSTIATGLGVAAIDTAQKVRQLPTAAAEAASTLRTAVGVAAIDAGTKLREVGTAAVDAGRSLGTGLRDGATQAGQALSTGLQTAVTRAKVELDALPQTAANAGKALSTGLRDAGTAAGNGLVNGLHTGLMGVGNALSTAAGAARTGASAIGTAVGDGLKSIPGAVTSTFSTMGSAVNTGIGHLGRFTAAAAGAGASLGSTLGKGASSLVAFLGGPWGVAFAAAGVAVAGLGAVYEEFGSKVEQNAQKVITGSQTLAQAIAAEQAQLEHNVLWWNSAAEKQRAYADVAAQVTEEFKKQYAAMTPAQKLTTDVAIAQAALNDAVAQFGPTSSQAAAAADALAAANLRKKSADEGATTAAKSHSEALRDQQLAAQQALGGLLAVEDALGRVAKAEGEANTAVAEHGKDSAEAKEKLNDYAQAADQAAQAIGKQAGAMAEARAAGTGAAAETTAYGAALLTMAGNAKGPAQAALKGYLGQLSQAQLDALSAGLAAQGFGLKVMELPGGKTVKVAVDPETGKIVSTQQLLDALAKNPVMIKIGADTLPADQAFQQVLKAVQEGKATVNIDGQNLPALDALRKVGQQAGLEKAEVNIGGNPVNGMAALEGFITSVKTGNPMVNIGGQDYDARVVFAALKDTVVGEKLMAALGLDPSGANATLAGFKTSASVKVTMPLGAEPSSAMQTVTAAQATARTPQSFPLGSDASSAAGTVSGAQATARTPQSFPTGSDVSSATGSVDTAHATARTPQSFPTSSTTDGATGPISTVQGQARVGQSFATASTTTGAKGPIDTVQAQARVGQSFSVNATRHPALQGVIDGILAMIPGSKTIEVIFRRIFQTIGIPFADGGVLPMASGGVLPAQTRAYANGGADDPRRNEPGKTYDGHRLTSMSGNHAAVVAPKTYRVIGDNQRVPEVYIPLNGSQASLTYTGYAANEQGYALTPINGRGRKGAPRTVAMAGGGTVAAGYFKAPNIAKDNEYVTRNAAGLATSTIDAGSIGGGSFSGSMPITFAMAAGGALAPGTVPRIGTIAKDHEYVIRDAAGQPIAIVPDNSPLTQAGGGRVPRIGTIRPDHEYVIRGVGRAPIAVVDDGSALAAADRQRLGTATPPASSPPASGPSTPPAVKPGTTYTTSQVSTTAPFVQPAGSAIAQPPASSTPGSSGGGSIDLSGLIAEVKAVKAAVLSIAPNDAGVISAVTHLEQAVVGDRRGGHGYRAQCRRSDGELSRI